MTAKSLAEQMKLGVTGLTLDDYNQVLWPKICEALDIIFLVNEGDSIPLSYEEIYSIIYKCVCFQLGAQVYTDLINNVLHRLNHRLQDLQVLFTQQNLEACFHLLWDSVRHYETAMRAIVPIFNYLNRFYVETKEQSTLQKVLSQTFVNHFVLSQPVPGLLEAAQENSMLCSPEIQMNVVLTLHRMHPALADRWPALFQRFVSTLDVNSHPALLSQFAEEAQLMQARMEQEGVLRYHSDRKRGADGSLDDDHFRSAPSER